MNNYLLLLGNNFAEVRQLLNLTQEDLANKMGVSRPTIVKIEKDPSRLTNTLAFAFFIAVSYDLKSRIKKVKKIESSDYKSPDKIKNFIEELKKSSLLPIGTLVTVITISIGGVIPVLSAAAIAAGVAGIKYGIKSRKKNPQDEQQIKWDEEKAEKILEEVQKKLLEEQKKVLSCFQLNELEIEQFVNKIDKG